ncbi:MAG: hypothetical protein ACR2PK_11890 [Acidimicrobiales bacterium]
MKPLLIWVGIVGAVFAIFAVVTIWVRDTSRVFVVVDSSFPMSSVWSQVTDALDDIDDQSRAEFALATEKQSIHGWQSTLTLVGVEPFAPCTFETIAGYPQVTEADELILVTTRSSCDTSALAGWEIINLGP